MENKMKASDFMIGELMCGKTYGMFLQLAELVNIIEHLVMKYKPKKYLRTGIKPKYQNRTRKKQRLTRLQRRWKRQRK